MWARLEDDAVAEILLSARSVTVSGSVCHGAEIFTLWSPEQLAGIGIVPARYADTAPSPHHRATGEAWQIVGGEAVGTRAWVVPAAAASDLKAYAAEKRWRKEIGGIVVDGRSIPTDDRAKVLLMGASLGMSDEQTAPFVVGAAAVSMTGAQFKAAYAALVAHVQGCFATQTTVLAAIDAGTITTYAAIDAAFA